MSEKLSQAASLYQKSAITEGEQNYPLLTFAYTSCILRHSSLLFSIWSAKGWGPLAFTAMLQPGLPPTLSRDESTQWSNLERLSSLSGISRSLISSIIGQIHGPWLLHLAPRERINVLEITASIYACLGYKRKEIYILRESLGCIMDLIVCGREEDGLSRPTNVPGTSGLGLHGITPTPGDTAVAIRFGESGDGNESILRLLKHICKVLGVDLEAVKLVDADEQSSQSVLDANNATIDSDPDQTETHGWPELQLGVVREAVAIAEALPGRLVSFPLDRALTAPWPDFLAVAQFASSALKTLRPILTPADQLHLHSTSTRALSVARRRGDTRSIEHWSGRPIMNIAITP